MEGIKRFFLLGSSGLFLGLAISCVVAMLILASKMQMFTKDVNEIIVSWFYLAIFATIAGLAGFIGTGVLLKTAGKL